MILAAIFASLLLQVAPDPSLTPGFLNPEINSSNMGNTVCAAGWSTSTLRPSSSYTHKIKIMVMNQYGYDGMPLKDFELDHLIPLELGGHPTDPRNLWPQPLHLNINGLEEGAYQKDRVENAARKAVCSGRMSLEEAQRAIATDWRGLYRKLIGAFPAMEH